MLSGLTMDCEDGADGCATDVAWLVFGEHGDGQQAEVSTQAAACQSGPAASTGRTLPEWRPRYSSP
jgi:hypothetical protein